uniref:Ig-like domain-containing protein n=1 Tax=Varanus komodoensis TaxID=61221 RepID=A0A8D2KR74_VARKO
MARRPLLLLPPLPLLLPLQAGSPRSVFRTTYTAVSEPGLGLPQFTAAAYVGDLPIARYDRLHTWQMMAGCEVGLDRPRGRYLRFGYDGSTYLSLEVETLTWTAADAMAQKMKRSWEANPSITQRFRAYVEKTCAEWSQARLDHGEEGLGRREPPKVTVAGRAGQDDTETLICRDHGFYPREIDMAWTRDGEVWLQDASHGVLAPNSDGTFYAWLSVRLDPWDRECFLCRVEHDALQTPVELAWEEPESLPTYNLGRLIWPTIGVLAVLLGIVVAVLSLSK